MRTAWKVTLRLGLSSTIVAAAACGAGASPEDVASSFAAIGESSEARSINIGFGGAATAPANDPFQFGASARFFAASVVQPGAHVCHRYLPWNIGLMPPGDGDVNDPTSRASFEKWLADPSNPCTDALVTFSAATGTAHPAPTDFHEVPGCETCYGTAVRAFVEQYTAGWAGSAPGRVFSFTAWNEPNNGANDGDGLGSKLSAETAAQYYLMARHMCGSDPSQCKVAAGDLASNGGLVLDFVQNCPSDLASPLCSKASWLDRYKDFIAHHANDPAFELGPSFRPEYWAYHAWHEINDYVYDGKECTADTDCATMALLHSLGGSWSGAPIWDTEVGSGQTASSRPDGGAIDDDVQARGAAYLLYLSSTLTDRIWRIYYQGVETGAWQILCGTTERPAFDVLAMREVSYSGGGHGKICGRSVTQ